jgi:hypothetical protein
MLIDGKCHCDNIAFVLDWPGVPAEIVARACSCTFCVKHGGVWTSNRDARLSATLHSPTLVSKYTFGTRLRRFMFVLAVARYPLSPAKLRIIFTLS